MATTYVIYREDDTTLVRVGQATASSAKSALRAAVERPDETKAYVAIPLRNHSTFTAKTKPAQVSWS